MEWGYEEKYDLLGIMMRDYDKEDYDHSVEVRAGFIIDLNKDNEILAIEILDWSRGWGIRPHQVKNSEIHVEIEKHEFCAKITVTGTYNDKIHEIVGKVFL